MSIRRIGEFAALAGVTADTIRYYETIQLLPAASRTSAGYRLYDDNDLTRVRFVKQAQSLGLSLAEIKTLLTARGGAKECRQVRDLLRAKIIQLDQQVDVLRAFRRTLADHLEECERELQESGEAAECPVIINMGRSDSIPRKDKKAKK
jgi:DNA-binding transcriptional MerR regulator